MNDRIKLAEAMGWMTTAAGQWFYGPDHLSGYQDNPPDPFTDANDDYAVLRWFAEQEDSQQREGFLEIIYDIRLTDYVIGDYARAALKVLDD